LFCSLQLAANLHQEAMSLQVLDFWKRNVNHFQRFSTCLHHFLQAKMFNPFPLLV
jgi:hypothetical protein